MVQSYGNDHRGSSNPINQPTYDGATDFLSIFTKNLSYDWDTLH